MRLFRSLQQELQRLEGIGPKSAQRIALQMARIPGKDVESIAHAILEFKRALKKCSRCGAFTDSEELCDICVKRAHVASVCVVESYKDLLSIEESCIWQGRYHILGALFSPMHGIGVDALFLQPLFSQASRLDEVCIAIPPSVEGEATSHYIASMLRKLSPSLKVTCISYGIPVNGSLEDPLTLAKAINGRVDFS